MKGHWCGRQLRPPGLGGKASRGRGVRAGWQMGMVCEDKAEWGRAVCTKGRRQTSIGDTPALREAGRGTDAFRSFHSAATPN